MSSTVVSNAFVELLLVIFLEQHLQNNSTHVLCGIVLCELQQNLCNSSPPCYQIPHQASLL